jgi:DNA-binding SARP family transcriptional activator
MAGRVSHGLARIVAEIDEQTLCRHPAAWCATIILRRCTISNAQSLAEGHAVWKQLDESTPVAVRLGVGTVLVNDLLLNGRADEARPIVQRLNEWIAREPEGAGGSALIVELYDRWMALREGQIPKGNSDYRRRMLPLLETATETRALFHYEFDAREALMRFDCDAASRAHARAVETARMAESPTPRLIIFPGVAFFAWLMGDDEQFRSLLSEMADLNRPPTDVSCRHFLECALGDATLSLRLNELPYQSAFAEIIGAARTSGAARESLSLAALQAAEEDGSAIVLTLALLCRAFCCAAERTAAFEKAASYARRIETGAWTEAIVQLQNRQGPFKAFAARFDAAREEALRLLIGERQLLNGDRQIPLTPREVAVFLALERASRDVGATELASILLPNEDEDSAATALRVRINRIRAKAAPLKAILSSNSGYALPTGFRTDLAEAEQIVRLLERGEKPSDEQMRRLERFAQAGLGRLTLEWADFEFGAAVLRRLEDVRRRSLLALARRAREYGDFTTACHWASIAREQDPFDEEAAAIVVEMYARLGRHAEAERMAREFSEQLYGELGVRPRAEVFAMLRSKRQT